MLITILTSAVMMLLLLHPHPYTQAIPTPYSLSSPFRLSPLLPLSHPETTPLGHRLHPPPFPSRPLGKLTHLAYSPQSLSTPLFEDMQSSLTDLAPRYYPERIHPRLGSLLRQNPFPRLQNFQENLYRTAEDFSPSEDVDGASLLVLYALPRSSAKRGQRSGWKARSRGRRGKGWALGGKRQAVLDRMPLSYGKKRQAWSSGQPLGSQQEEGEVAVGEGINSAV